MLLLNYHSLQCKPEYKVPGLYVIDSIVRQSRHQFGQEKDVFAPRFSNNIISTFQNLYRCPGDDKVNHLQLFLVKTIFSISSVKNKDFNLTFYLLERIYLQTCPVYVFLNVACLSVGIGRIHQMRLIRVLKRSSFLLIL